MEEIQNGNLSVSNPSSSMSMSKWIANTAFCKKETLKEESNLETLFCCLNQLPNGKKIIEELDLKLEWDTLFVEFLKKQTQELYHLEKYMECDFVVVQKTKDYNTLLFDNRFLSTKRKKQSAQFLGMIFDKEGCLIDIKNDVSLMPKLLRQNFQRHLPEEPLFQLVNLPEKEKNPKTFEETMLFLKKHKLEKEFYVFYQARHFQDCWTNLNMQVPQIEAFTKKDYTLGFRKMKPEKPKQIKKQKEEELVKPTASADKFQLNYSAAVKVQLNGLNQAHSLGCISTEEFQNLSKKLSGSAASMWIECDDENNARYVTFMSGKKKFQKDMIVNTVQGLVSLQLHR